MHSSHYEQFATRHVPQDTVTCDTLFSRELKTFLFR